MHKDSLKSNPVRPSVSGMRRSFSPMRLLVLTVAGVFLAEVIAMIVIYFFRSIPYEQQILLDATVMTIIIFPLLYYLSTRPLLQHIRQLDQTERVLESRLQLIQFADTHSLDELLQAVLDKIEALTGSSIGYFHFIDPDQKTLRLKTWSTHTLLSMCEVPKGNWHYDVEQAGVWADCIRERKPIIHNDFNSLPQRKGLPEGHATILREMSVPILRDGLIVAVLGVGNKPENYLPADVELVTTLADFAWDTIEHKQAVEALRESEEKFRTLADWTYDWELWLDPPGRVIYNSPSCQRITGYGADEFVEDPSLLVRIVHPDDRPGYEEHQRLLHADPAGMERLEYRVLARDGSEHWIEHICRPLYSAEHKFLGRRISNRDVTARKIAEQEIQTRNEKEKSLIQTIHKMQLEIARDLHDTLGQNISFLRLKLAHLAEKRTHKRNEIQAEIQNMTRAADESYDLIRGTLAILQSVNSTDLYRLFSRYAEQIEERAAFKTICTSHGEPRPLSTPRMRQVFFIYREALNNIEKHAAATEVSIEMLWNPNHLSLIISDNGKGFESSLARFGSHYGLRFMRERVELLNGALTIQSQEGSGTRIEVQIPYE